MRISAGGGMGADGDASSGADANASAPSSGTDTNASAPSTGTDANASGPSGGADANGDADGRVGANVGRGADPGAALREVVEVTVAVPLPSRPLRAIEELSPERYKIVFTASEEMRKKLKRLTDLMSHSVPSGDLGAILERAVDLLIAKKENQKFGKTSRPRPEPTGTDPAAVHRATRREVSGRDEERCIFIGDDGERCPETGFVEFDHLEARALGGTGEADKIRLLCRDHNRLVAEERFGKEFIEEKIRLRQRKRSGLSAQIHDALIADGFDPAEARRAAREIEPKARELIAEVIGNAVDRPTPTPQK